MVAVIFARGSEAATTAQKLHKSTTTVAWYEGKGWWHLRPGVKKCAQLHFRKPERRCTRHRRVYRFHQERVEKLTPKPVIGHRAGWLCIHRGEAAWDNDGVYWDGSPSPYHGGLQMTLGWMGLVGNAAYLSPEAQMAVAETGYRLSGYSDAWMRGQWPNTYPPCAHLF